MVFFGSDYRQTLPVIPKSTAADELNACLKASSLWRHVKKFQLTTNVRVQLQNDQSAARFSQQFLSIGNVEMPIDPANGLITLPTDFCHIVNSKK